MKKKTVLWIVSAAVVVIMCVVLAILLLGLLRGYEVNKPDTEAGLEVPGSLMLYSGKDIGFSFLYPTGRAVSDLEQDGVYIYPDSSAPDAYVLVWRGKGTTSPEKHFAACGKTMQKTFDNLKATPIQEVHVGEKTLYLTRYVGTLSGRDIVADRYLEIYRNSYIQYTAISESAGSLNTELYYAISTLRLQDGAYQGSYSEKMTKHEHPDMGFSIKLPDMLTTKELTIGYFASNDDAVLLSLNCVKDDRGDPIYNRQDFLDRADESSAFVPSVLGADSVSFSNGQKQKLGGKEFYCYPMEMEVGGETYSGMLCLTNAADSGCFLLCYAAREGSPNYDMIRELCTKACESIRFEG